jgi:hypothetical protein
MTEKAWDAEDFDEAAALAMVGKTALIGVTYCSADGAEQSHSQFVGTVSRVNLEDGLVLECRDGSERTFPPYAGYYSPAEPGIYKLRSSGEEVENPDIVATWRVRAPQ